ncbi:MAG: ANTAR domain-containing protein [Lachnospiraceae bacterium]|nr:ANTAR domain-containing protein [Lachnospiraceae bacterium]
MLSLIIAFPKLEDAKKLKLILQRNDYSVAGIFTQGRDVLDIADKMNNGIVICGYKLEDMNYMTLKDSLKPGFTMLLVTTNTKVESGLVKDVSYITAPLTQQKLLSAVTDITEEYYKQSKQRRDRNLNRPDEDKALILSAKELLMRKNDLTEPEAHRYMQKISMDSGSSMVETAKKILTLYG